jgi:nucleoside 2-deoxyribosyltransferase
MRHASGMAPIDVFVAYPGSDSLRAEAVRNGAKLIAERLGLDVLVWEKMQSTGNVLIEAIQAKIREAKIVIAEISSLNANVLFEVGYALSQNKHIWLLVDTTDDAALTGRRWDSWRQLDTPTTSQIPSIYTNSLPQST